LRWLGSCLSTFNHVWKHSINSWCTNYFEYPGSKILLSKRCLLFLYREFINWQFRWFSIRIEITSFKGYFFLISEKGLDGMQQFNAILEWIRSVFCVMDSHLPVLLTFPLLSFSFLDTQWIEAMKNNILTTQLLFSKFRYFNCSTADFFVCFASATDFGVIVLHPSWEENIRISNSLEWPLNCT